jgi:hypothetical protein
MTEYCDIVEQYITVNKGKFSEGTMQNIITAVNYDSPDVLKFSFLY